MTAATVTLGPGPKPGPGPGEIADDILERITGDDFARWEHRVANTGYCHHPIRLRGQIRAVDLATGETGLMYSTASEPDGVLLTTCGNRREHVCPPCSAVYKRDARQLVKAGLAGGKGVPATVAAHPCVFATLTAPSFGPVHTRRTRAGKLLPCRARRDRHERRCPHGRDISCAHRHPDADPRLGRPLCPDCYDYPAAVLFNANAADLWRRFITYLPRRLATVAGVTAAQLRRDIRIRYVKVAEYQARGVVHFHAVIRLDASGDGYQPPPGRYAIGMLSDAIEHAAAGAYVAADHDSDGGTVVLRFGAQTDTRPIRHGPDGPLTAQAVANYIGKYATKSLDAPGLPARPIRSIADISRLTCSRHYQQMIATAWHLGGKPGASGERLRKWAHMLGYGGHYLTKSRRYSVTFGQLRAARTAHRREQRHPDGEHDPWGRELDETVVLVLTDWQYAGTGYHTPGDHQLALSAAARAREHAEWAAPAA
ncbi:MAG TPA: replication initiator [Streptosporangiaceae bacterium]|nr:replication initiator [Streptosporangiaceae bacterium]